MAPWASRAAAAGGRSPGGRCCRRRYHGDSGGAHSRHALRFHAAVRPAASRRETCGPIRQVSAVTPTPSDPPDVDDTAGWVRPTSPRHPSRSHKPKTFAPVVATQGPEREGPASCCRDVVAAAQGRRPGAGGRPDGHLGARGLRQIRRRSMSCGRAVRSPAKTGRADSRSGGIAGLAVASSETPHNRHQPRDDIEGSKHHAEAEGCPKAQLTAHVQVLQQAGNRGEHTNQHPPARAHAVGPRREGDDRGASSSHSRSMPVLGGPRRASAKAPLPRTAADPGERSRPERGMSASTWCGTPADPCASAGHAPRPHENEKGSPRDRAQRVMCESREPHPRSADDGDYSNGPFKASHALKRARRGLGALAHRQVRADRGSGKDVRLTGAAAAVSRLRSTHPSQPLPRGARRQRRAALHATRPPQRRRCSRTDTSR